MMVSILPYVQITLGVLLTLGILLQRSDATLGTAFGVDASGGAQFSRRGFERILFFVTLTVGGLFIISTFLALIL